jgi:hypothetical protein
MYLKFDLTFGLIVSFLMTQLWAHKSSVSVKHAPQFTYDTLNAAGNTYVDEKSALKSGWKF